MNRWPGHMLMILFLFLPAASIMADSGNKKLKDSKQELDRIKSQINETRQKVDSLNQLESELQKTISQYGERVSRNRKLVQSTEQKLRTVRKSLDQNNELLQQSEQRLNQKRTGYLNLLTDFYRRKKTDVGVNVWDFDSVMAQGRRVQYLASISGRSTREIAQVDDSIKLLSQYVDSLQQTDSDLDRLRREKTAKINLDLTLKEKEETSLGNIKRQSNIMQERLATLSEAAREMEDIIAALERAQERRRLEEGPAARFRSGSFDQLKGALLPPIKGRIVSSFGWKKNEVTKLSSFSPGIDIRPSQGWKDIRACAPGRVAYVGRLRGYDNFVIMEHDDDFYTTYAGLASVTVELDDLLNAGDKVGIRGEGNVHFELRRGREHLDPVIWLDINEF